MINEEIQSAGGEGAKEIRLTHRERKAIESLKRLAKRWPHTLLIFCGGTGMTVRKVAPNGSYGAECVVDSIYGIRNDGGDGGDCELR